MGKAFQQWGMNYEMCRSQDSEQDERTIGPGIPNELLHSPHGCLGIERHVSPPPGHQQERQGDLGSLWDRTLLLSWLILCLLFNTQFLLLFRAVVVISGRDIDPRERCPRGR